MAKPKIQMRHFIALFGKDVQRPSIVGKKALEIGTASAVCHMNDGSKSISNALERM